MQCIDFYTQFVKDPNLLAHGHILIRDYLLQSQINRSNTLTNLLHPNPPIIALVGNVYAVDVYPQLGEQEKSMTRSYLMQMLLNAINKEGLRSKNVDAILQIMRKMHHQEGYSSWVSLYAKLIQNIKAECFGGLIIKILDGADNRISDLSCNIFVYVIQNHGKYNLTTEKVLEILFYCVKSFAYMCGADDEKLITFYKPYQQQFVDFIWSNLRTNPLCMKFGFKLLTLLYGQMNYHQNQSQSSKANIQNLTVFGLEICQEYLKIVSDPAYNKSFNIQQYAQQFEEPASLNQCPAYSIAENIHVIMFQLFDFYEVLLLQDEDEEQKSRKHGLNGIHIMISALVGAVLSVSEMHYWHKNTSEYIVAVENEHQIVLRNKCSQLVFMLVDSHEKKQQYAQFIVSYFSTVAMATQKDPIAALAYMQQFINEGKYRQNKFIPNQLTLAGEFSHYEQSAYFILSSTIDKLFKNEQKQKLLNFLMHRTMTVQSSIIKILTILIIVGQMKQPAEKRLKQFILSMISKFGSNEQLQMDRSLDDIGVALALGRGLGKICCSEHIQINKDIPSRYIDTLISYLMNITTERMLEEDGSHIALELIIRLTDCEKFRAHNLGKSQNKVVLQKLFTPAFQEAMLTHYMNDIYLSSMIIELLNVYPLQETITGLVNLLLSGSIQNQKYVELIVKWLQSGHVSFSNEHILTILQVYQSTRRSLIQPIIKQYLNWMVKNKNTQNADNYTVQIAHMLNNAPDQTWLVAMLQCGILADPAGVLVKCIQKITYQITSQYELECKMILPFYLGIHETQNFMQVLQSQPKLYKQFVQKLFRYAQLFRGQHLKVITSLFWLKLCQIDRSLVTNTVTLIEGYGELTANEWQDQLDMQDAQGEKQEDIMERLIGGKLQNEQMQKELQQLFKELSWNSEQINRRVSELKQSG